MTGAPPVRLLGPVAVHDDGDHPVDLGPARQRAVLAVLLLDAGMPVPAVDLITRVWGDEPPPAADQALRSYLCRLRKAVEMSASVRIARRDGGYAATVPTADLDLAMFRGWASRARVAVRDGRLELASDCFDHALALTSGTLLAGVASTWLDERRRLLVREIDAVVLERNDLALAIGAPERVVADALGRLASEPYDERVGGQAMLALAGVGRAAEALNLYQQIRERLATDLGIDPAPALQDVHQRVLRGVRPGPARPAPPPAGAGAASGPGRAPVVPRQLPPAVRGFVDRTAESRTLDRLLCGGEEPSTVVVCGPGGAGKTALAVRWGRERSDRFPDGQLYVDLHGFDAGCRPTSPQAALRGLLTGLGLEPAGIPSALADLVGVYRTVLADRRVLLIADDAASAEQVRPLLPPGPGSAALVTSRSGLAGLAASAGAHVLPIGLFDDTGSRQLLTRRLGPERTGAEASAIDRLVARCGGLPLALAIVAGRAAALPSLPLRSVADELDDESRRLAALSGDEGTDLAAVVGGSVAALSATARAALEWLAAGPRVSIRTGVVAALADLTLPDAEEVLRELLGIHLLEPDGPDRFRLHDLVRLAVRSRPTTGTEAAADRLLTALLAVPGERGQDPTDLLAALSYADETGRDADVCDLASALEAPLGSSARWSELVEVNDRAISAAARLGDDRRRATILIGRGRGAIGLRDFGRAETDLTEALSTAEETDDLDLRARAHRALARLAAHRHRFDVALRHDEQGLVLQRRLGSVLGEAHAFNAIGWHLAHLGRADEALARCRRGLVIFVEHGDRPGQALTQDSIGYALERLGRLDDAQAAYRRGAELCRELGWQVVLVNTLHRLADVSRRRGDRRAEEEARAEVEEILRLTGRQALEP